MKRAAPIIVLVVLSAARTSHAQTEADPDARAQSQRGLEEYRAGHFREAADAFSHAYEITHDVQLLLNLGNSQYQSGDLRSARDTFARYLNLATSDLRDRPYVIARLREIDARIEVEAARARAAVQQSTARPPPPRVIVRTIEPPPPPTRAPIFVLELAMGAAGLMALGVGGAFWLDAGARYDQCARNPCAIVDEPRGQEAAGVAIFWTGAVVTALSGTFFAITLTRPRYRPRVVRASALGAIRVGLLPTGGLSLAGQF
jgi:tetratricopeptide (TPR) repeat protein